MRAVLPYLVASLAIAILTGAAYGLGWIGVAGVLVGILLAAGVALPGAERWDALRHR
jgi:hypothetical protein